MSTDILLNLEKLSEVFSSGNAQRQHIDELATLLKSLKEQSNQQELVDSKEN